MVSEVTAYQEKLLPQDWFSNGLGAKFTALGAGWGLCAWWHWWCLTAVFKRGDEPGASKSCRGA